MSGEETRGSQSKDYARPTDAQGELYQGLKAHQSDLEIQQDAAAPACGLDDRIEAPRRVLQWLDHQAFEIEPQAPPSYRWNSHSGDTQRIRSFKAQPLSFAMPTIDLPADELAAVTAAIRGLIEGDRYPHAPRQDALRAALARLDAAMAPELPKAPGRGRHPSSGSSPE